MPEGNLVNDVYRSPSGPTLRLYDWLHIHREILDNPLPVLPNPNNLTIRRVHLITPQRLLIIKQLNRVIILKSFILIIRIIIILIIFLFLLLIILVLFLSLTALFLFLRLKWLNKWHKRRRKFEKLYKFLLNIDNFFILFNFKEAFFLFRGF